MGKKVIIYARHSMNQEILEESVESLKTLAEDLGEKEYEVYSEVAKLQKDGFTPEFSKVVEMIGDDKSGLFALDKELGARTFVAPVIG